MVVETAKAPNYVSTAQTTIEPQTGAVKIEWEVPGDNGSKITGYQVAIKNVDGAWKQTKDCTGLNTMMRSSGSGKNLIVCLVKMKTLRTDFKLPFDSLVEVKVRAINFAGKGPWSRVNTTGVKVKQQPMQMDPPKRGELTSQKKIHVQWAQVDDRKASGDSMILVYVLENEGKQLYQGMNTQFTFDAVKGKVYKLKVAARNIYGLGAFSDALSIQAGAIPAPMKTIKSVNRANNKIQVTWKKPSGNIIAYQVMIYSKVGDKFVLDSICDGRKRTTIAMRTCTFDAKVLSRDYGYSVGDIFIAKVRARNLLGWGQWSKPNTTGATVFKLVRMGGN